jgi:hypothetical protein
MSINTLKEVVEATLHKLGNHNALRLIPELGAIDVSTSAALTNLLLDSNNVVFREEALLKVITYFKENAGINLDQIVGQQQREVERQLSNAEVRHVSRYCSAGLALKQNQTGISLSAIDGSSAAHCDERQDWEYIPLIGLAMGYQEGPIKTALDELFLSRINRGRSRNTICTRFLGNLLTLWRNVISYWIEGQLARDDIEEDISETFSHSMHNVSHISIPLLSFQWSRWSSPQYLLKVPTQLFI